LIYYWYHRSELSSSLNFLYSSVGISKQGVHQLLSRSVREQEEIRLLLEIIHQIRKDHPRMSCRSLYDKIKPGFMGRDKFEALCKAFGLQVVKARNARRTTDSSGVIRFENLLIDKAITDIDQAWSSDITYYELQGVFYYLTFILDNYSRRILGYYASGRLNTENTTLPAMKRAIRTRGGSLKEGIIFHSDGGGQYYDTSFLELTRTYKFRNSMCEYGWENGKAERVNGIIKNNYLIPWGVNTPESLLKNLDRAVQLYNFDKPHSALKRMTPVEFEKKVIALCVQTKETASKI